MPLKGVFKKFAKRASSSGLDAKASNKDPAGESGRRGVPSDEDLKEKGLHVLHEPRSFSEEEPCCPADIVFVHGLGGHWKRTWTHDNGTFWPRDLLPHAVPSARIFSYGYPSNFYANKSVAGIRDFAKHLLGDLEIIRKERSRPIIYVCHSLGGILFKQAMIIAQRSNFRDIWLDSKAVFFMGTPHRGSPYASYGKVVGDIVNFTLHTTLIHRFTGGVPTSLIEALTHESEELQSISEDFDGMLKNTDLQIISLYETEAHPYAKRTIVAKSSARLGAQSERFDPLFLNHQNLCRFSGKDDGNYIKVSSLIQREVSKELGDQKTMDSSLYSDHSFDETEKACASLLNTIDVAEYESKLDPKVEGTLEWVLLSPQYNDWVSNLEARLLLVTGYVGSGKTILASFIWRYLNEQHPRVLICRFFCDEKIEEYRDPCVLVRSLIFQIVNQRQRLWRVVKKASERGSLQIFNQFDNLWNLFEQLVRTEKKYPIKIIIDAIDEFDQGTQNRVISRITRLLSLGNTTLMKFFITMRPNAKCAVDLQICSAQAVHLSLTDSKENVDNDIRSVVRHRLERMEKLGICKTNVRDSLEESLIAKADRTFLWITLVLRLLEERRLLLWSDIEKAVTLLPMTLASLYKHLLSSIPARDQPTAARILRLLVLCDRPLTGEEIGIMLTITPNHRTASSLKPEHLPVGQDSVLSVLGPLVRKHGSRIELVHQSLKDYLTQLPSEAQDPLALMFGVDQSRDSLVILRACSMYLCLEELQHTFDTSMESFHYSCSDDEESASNSSTSLYGLNLFDEPMFKEDHLAEDSTWAGVNAKYQLFDYAALHWAKVFATCKEIANEHDNEKALLLYEIGTPKHTNWLHYFWYKEMHYEPFPSVIDSLMVASYFGHASNLSFLLQESESMDPEALMRALYWAARQGHTACVVTLLQRPDCDPQCSTMKNQIPLLAAAQFGHLDCVKILLDDSRVNINTQDGSGRTALSLAVENNHIETVTALLDREDLDVNLQDKASNTPLHISIGAASASIVTQLLKDKRAKIEQLDRRGRSILSWAAELGAVEVAALILKTLRIPIDKEDFAGRTPLSYAAQNGHLPVVKMLVKSRQANPLSKDKTGRNAHSWAAIQRHSEVLSYLLGKCPDGADEEDNNGWTPLAWTLDPPGYPENMRLLLRHSRVDVNRKDDSIHGRTVLSWIASYGYTQMALEMVDSGRVNLDAQDLNGRTPLSEAAGNGHVEIVRLLIVKGGVEVNSRDQQGQTPLFWADKGGHEDTVRLLKENHATL